MRIFSRTLILAILTAAGAGSPNRASGQLNDDLFSSVRVSNAFTESDAASVGQDGTKTSGWRITSTDELVSLLQEGRFEVASKGNRTASTQKALDSWVFPVTVTVSEDEEDVSIVLGLRAVSDAKKLPATRLLQLLESNEKSGRTSFAFNRERNRIELFCLINNSGMNAQLLRDEINRLAILARDNEAAWNLEESAGGAAMTNTVTANGGAAKVVQTAQTGTAPMTTPSNTAPSSSVASPATSPASVPSSTGAATAELTAAALQGRWSASRSAKEAFAVQLNADATFVLVSVINGKQARSTGKFTLLQSQLTLEGSDGIRLVASVKLISASEFRFEQQSAGTTGVALTFRKAP